MKKLFCLLMAAALMLSLLAGCSNANTPSDAESGAPNSDSGGQTPQTDAETIRIGMLTALNADGSLMFWFSEAGIEMAMDEVGSFEGKKIELIYRQPGDDATVCKQNLTELKEMGCVAIISMVDDSFGPVVVQWSNENQFPIVSTTNYSSEMYLNNSCRYYFNCGLNSWGYAKMFANEAVAKRGYTSYAYIGTDGSACLDANHHFLLEGQKINPDFKCVADYRLSYTDTEFSTILATVLGMNPVPEMTFQAGGYTVLSFLQQSSLYEFFEKSSAWSDVLTISTIVTPLSSVGAYPFGGSYGVSNLAWWQDEFKDHVAAYDAKCLELFGETYLPHDYELQQYWCTKAVLLGIKACLDAGNNPADSTALTEAIGGLSWTDVGGEHSFRDFDHQMTYNLYFVDAQDSGEENGYMAIPSDLAAVYTADQWLPTYEEIAEYAAANNLTFPNN